MVHLIRWTAALLLAAGSPAAIAETPAWPDSYIGRLQAQALLQTLNANILAGTSATLSLETWCADHGMAREPKVVARLLRGADRPAAPEVRARLAVAPDTPLKYRRVQLYCGEHLLSEADNWYVPARLTAAMNQLLEHTDTPFGKVVLPLAPYRRTVAMKTLWSPLPERWETRPCPPSALPRPAPWPSPPPCLNTAPCCTRANTNPSRKSGKHTSADCSHFRHRRESKQRHVTFCRVCIGT